MGVIKSGFKSKFKSKSAPVDYGGDQVSWYTIDYGGDQVSWYIIVIHGIDSLQSLVSCYV